jgi:hypothetical protein
MTALGESSHIHGAETYFNGVKFAKLLLVFSLFTQHQIIWINVMTGSIIYTN